MSDEAGEGFTIYTKIDDTEFQHQVEMITDSLNEIQAGASPMLSSLGNVSGSFTEIQESMSDVGDVMGEALDSQSETQDKQASKAGKQGEGMFSKLSEISKGILPMIGIAVSVGSLVAMIIESSGILKSVLSILNTGVLLILRPIGDFIGFLLRPVAILFLKFAVQFYRDVFPTIKAIGETGGKALAAFFADPVGSLAGLGQMIVDAIVGWSVEMAVDFDQGVKDLQTFFDTFNWEDHITNTFDAIESTLTFIFGDLPQWLKDALEAGEQTLKFFITGELPEWLSDLLAMIDFTLNVTINWITDTILTAIFDGIEQIVNVAIAWGILPPWFLDVIHEVEFALKMAAKIDWGTEKWLNDAIANAQIVPLKIGVDIANAFTDVSKWFSDLFKPQMAFAQEMPVETMITKIGEVTSEATENVKSEWMDINTTLIFLHDELQKEVVPKWQEMSRMSNQMALSARQMEQSMVSASGALKRGVDKLQSAIDKLKSVGGGGSIGSASQPATGGKAFGNITVQFNIDRVEKSVTIEELRQPVIAILRDYLGTHGLI